MLAVLTLALWVAGLAAQEPAPSSTELAPTIQPQAEASQDTTWQPSVSLRGLIAVPGEGEITSGGEVLYSDLLRNGVGAATEFTLDHPISAQWELGGYLTLAWTHFGGSEKGDGFNDSIRSQGLDTVALVLGPEVRWSFLGDFYGQGYLGVGWLRESSMKATITVNGIPHEGQELLRESNRLLGEAGIRIGWNAGQAALYAGASIQVSGGPSAGRDAGLLQTASVPVQVRPGTFAPVVFELGLELGF